MAQGTAGTLAGATYNDHVVRQFALMTIVWGVVGMSVGVLLAAQLIWPALNFDVPWLTYSRLRPLHTNAVIFAFGGSALFASSYYIVQRTCHVRLISDRLAGFTFWGWQLIILLAAITLPLGITSGDRRSTVARVTAELGIADADGRMDPQEKLALIRGLQAQGRRVLMVGDGINDGPVLASAHVSCAMGAGRRWRTPPPTCC